MTEPEFIYVSAVEGKLVPRYASLLMGANIPVVYIGAVRTNNPKTGRGIVKFDLEEVVAIPRLEFMQYRRQYRAAILNGELRERKVEDFKKWLATQAARNSSPPEAQLETQPDPATAADAQKKQRGAKS